MAEPPAYATVADVVAELDSLYPPRLKEDWDRVGLSVGDPTQQVRRIAFAVDPVAATVDEALAWGADLLVTHHPLLLRGVHSVAATSYKGALVHKLIRGGCALYSAHTNADAVVGGVADALAAVVGVRVTGPLMPIADRPLDSFCVFVPVEYTDSVRDAMADAGAGKLGAYSDCAWSVTGTGQFRPEAGSRPFVGEIGRVERVVEDRLEMVVPRPRRAAVLAAMRAAHPYQEPAFDVIELADTGSAAGVGRLGVLDEPMPLRRFAVRVARALPATAHGVRVAGDPEGPVETVAIVGGAGDSLFAAVRAAGVDAYLTADLRHHPASEAREEAALTGGRPYLIDVSHAASEWPWLDGAAGALGDRLAARGITVETTVSRRNTDPWTWHVPSVPMTGE